MEHPLHQMDPTQRRLMMDTVGRALASVPGIRLAWVFGSFARGEPFHDLDLGLCLEDRGDWHLPLRAGQVAWEALGWPDFDVYAVPLDDAPPHFRRQVAEEGVAVLEIEAGLAFDWTILAISQHLDWLEWRRVRKEEGTW